MTDGDPAASTDEPGLRAITDGEPRTRAPFAPGRTESEGADQVAESAETDPGVGMAWMRGDSTPWTTVSGADAKSPSAGEQVEAGDIGTRAVGTVRLAGRSGTETLDAAPAGTPSCGEANASAPLVPAAGIAKAG